MNLAEQLSTWSNTLSATSDTPQLDAQVLLKHISSFDDVRLIIDADKPLSETLITQTQRLIERRAQGMPIAYLTGQREFYSLNFKVNEHVLIPRPETELLVESAQQYINNNDVKTVLDLGTGSGAIAISLATQNPNIQFTASDNCRYALQIAQQNATQHKAQNIRFVQSNWYARLKGSHFDLILSNPPYIDPEDTHLKQGDVRFEPNIALLSENHGMADLQQIICSSKLHLAPDGGIILEHGYDQKSDVQKLLEDHCFTNIRTLQDIAGHDRTTIGILSS